MSIDSLLAVIRGRRSVREFGPEEATDEEMRLLVEAARHAPSNSNRQAWKFLAVRNGDIRARLREAVEDKARAIREKASDPEEAAILEQFGPYLTFFVDAPLLFVVLYKRAVDPSHPTGGAKQITCKRNRISHKYHLYISEV